MSQLFLTTLNVVGMELDDIPCFFHFCDKYMGCRLLRLLHESVGFNKKYLCFTVMSCWGVSSFGLFPGFDDADRLSIADESMFLSPSALASCGYVSRSGRRHIDLPLECFSRFGVCTLV